MAETITFTLPGLATIERALLRAPDLLQDEMRRFFAFVLPYLTSEVQDRTPTAEGHLRNSIIGREEISATGMIGVVGTPLDYAPAVEHGSKPHPVSEEGILALAEWAKRKLPLGQATSVKTGRPLKTKGLDELATSVAHAIAWKIRHHGTPAAHMFRDGFAAAKPRIMAQWEAAMARLVQRIGQGA